MLRSRPPRTDGVWRGCLACSSARGDRRGLESESLPGYQPPRYARRTRRRRPLCCLARGAPGDRRRAAHRRTPRRARHEIEVCATCPAAGDAVPSHRAPRGARAAHRATTGKLVLNRGDGGILVIVRRQPSVDRRRLDLIRDGSELRSVCVSARSTRQRGCPGLAGIGHMAVEVFESRRRRLPRRHRWATPQQPMPPRQPWRTLGET